MFYVLHYEVSNIIDGTNRLVESDYVFSCHFEINGHHLKTIYDGAFRTKHVQFALSTRQATFNPNFLRIDLIVLP